MAIHNQRIERLRRDLYSSCICHFFYFLEDLNLLDPNNPVDSYVIHLIFLPLIQKHLDLFKNGWAKHPLRTERSRTPLQLWILGLTSTNPASIEAASVLEVSHLLTCVL